LDQLDVTGAFDSEIPVPAVKDLRELQAVLRDAGVFDTDGDINAALNSIQSFNGSESVGVGIKTVLTLAESSRLAGDDPVQWFSEQLSNQIQRNNPRMS
jgi:vesicle-fusing ATPase